MSNIRTRIAPSPTGKFHIGTARTALFSYLYAKKKDGEFLLRFEDTDRERSTQEFEGDIRDGLEWLGLNWDEEYKQMDRLDIYKDYAEKLIQLEEAYEKDGAVWFKVKKGRTIKFNDLIRGEISFNTDEFEDFVIVKSSGIPTFYFSNSIDDYDMKITHVLRGEDHITNTPKQIMINQALGFELPQYGHIPLILNEDKSKLSKRKNAVSVSEYQEKGYLREAIVNFLVLMGWNPGDEREFFTLEELAKSFSLERVQKSPAIFNIEKLNSINSHYINLKTDSELSKELGLNERLIKISKSRAKTLLELKEQAGELINYNKKFDPAMLVFKKSDKAKTIKGLQTTESRLQTANSEIWDNLDTLNGLLQKIVSDEELDNGSVFWPIRVALSGLDKSPSPTELLWALGKEESLKRIEFAIKKLK